MNRLAFLSFTCQLGQEGERVEVEVSTRGARIERIEAEKAAAACLAAWGIEALEAA